MGKAKTIQGQFQQMLGNRIREIREEKGLSQSEVANLCGKDRASYARVENGMINPSSWYLQHIAMALGVELKELFDVELPKPER